MFMRAPIIFSFVLMIFSCLVYPSDLDEFIRLDIDQDGKLTEMEFLKLSADRGASRRGGGSERASEQFTKADANGDRRLSPSEFSALRSKRGSRARP